MLIVGLLMALVGPFSIDIYDKTKAKEELFSMKNWMKSNSFRSFAMGKESVFVLDKNKIVFSFSEKVNKSFYLESEEVDHSLSDKQNTKKNFEITFKYLSFPYQSIKVNSFGIVTPRVINVMKNNERISIKLAKSDDVTKK